MKYAIIGFNFFLNFKYTFTGKSKLIFHQLTHFRIYPLQRQTYDHPQKIFF